MRGKVILIITALLLLLSFSLAACSSESKENTNNGEDSESAATGAAENEKTITYAFGATWGSLVPYTYSSTYSSTVQSMVYEHLVRVTEDGSIEPRAAKSWEISGDGTKYTFHLRQDATWQDGEKATANDWVFGAEFITNPEIVAPAKSFLSIIKGIDDSGNKEEGKDFGIYAADEDTLVIETDAPTFLESLIGSINSGYIALPEHLFADIDPATWAENDFWKNPVGNGPFKFVKEISGQELVLAANENYYRDIQFDKLVFKVIASANIPTAFLAGEIDAAYPYITADQSASLEGKDNVVVTENKQDTSLMFLSLNVQNIPKNVRRAISLAIDKKLITEQIILGKGEATSSFLNSSSKYADTGLSVDRDIEQAKELIQKSGWDANKSINLTVPSGVREKVAAIVQQNLAEVGIRVELSVADATTLFAGLRDGSIDSGLITWTITPGNPIYFQSLLNPNVANFVGIKDNTYQTLINQINEEQNEDNRLILVKQLQKLIVDESAYIPIYHENTFVVTSSRVSNITVVNTEAPWEWTVAQ